MKKSQGTARRAWRSAALEHHLVPIVVPTRSEYINESRGPCMRVHNTETRSNSLVDSILVVVVRVGLDRFVAAWRCLLFGYVLPSFTLEIDASFLTILPTCTLCLYLIKLRNLNTALYSSCAFTFSPVVKYALIVYMCLAHSGVVCQRVS